MLRLPHFRLVQPRSLEEAVSLLDGEGPGVRVVAGGTDLWPNMKRRHQKAATVVSLMGIPELAGVRNGDGNGELRLGATTLLADLEHHPEVLRRYPALARAVASISSPPLRQMGTLGGNICVDTRCTYYNQTEEWRASIDYCMKEEGTICWVATSSPRCWAHSASDTAPVLQALGAEVRLVSAQGERVIPIAGLYQDDGIDYLAKKPDELVTEVMLPAEAAAGRCKSAFWKLRRRGSIDFAVLSAAVALWLDGGGVIERAAIVLGAVGSSPRTAPAAERFLVGKRPDEEALAEAARLARKAAVPMDNTDFQAQWRKAIAGRYIEAALREAAGHDPGLMPPRHP